MVGASTRESQNSRVIQTPTLNRSINTCQAGNSPDNQPTPTTRQNTTSGNDTVRKCICLGIDPGCSGGIVAIYPDKILSTQLGKMDRYDIRNWIETRANYAKTFDLPIYCLLEQVAGFIGVTEEGQKRNIASAHTTFRLGESYGMLQMSLVSSRISFQEILPREWQKRIGITQKEKGEKQHQFKGRLKERAKQLFPEEKITLQTSDAYLLAYLCRRMNK